MDVVQGGIDGVLVDDQASYRRSASSEATSMQIQLKTVTRALKIMRQMIDRLVVNQQQFPTLKLNKNEHVEVTMGGPLYYRVEIEGLSSPLKVEVELEDENEPGTFQILMSTKVQHPSPGNCEERFQNQKSFYIASNKIGQTKEEV